MLNVKDRFPRFEATAVVSTDPAKAFDQITNESYAEKWLVVFAYPKDFTFVCPTEIAEFGRLYQDFAQRGAQVLGMSTDSEYVHLAWRQSHPDLAELPFPLIADVKRELSTALGILDPE